MTVPHDPSGPESPPPADLGDDKKAGAILSALLGGLILVLTCVGYFRLASLSEQKEKESLGAGEGYGFMTILLILPCLLGVGLLIGAAVTASKIPADKPPNT